MIGYNINVLQQTACLVVNPIKVVIFAFLFNCTPVGRTSDSMTVPTLLMNDALAVVRLIWVTLLMNDALAVVRPIGVYLLDFFCSGIKFYLLLSLYLCSISFLYLDL